MITFANMNPICKLLFPLIGLLIIACGNPGQNASEANYIDSVTEALSNGDDEHAASPSYPEWGSR